MEINKYNALLYLFQCIGIFMSVFFIIQYIIVRKKEHLFYALYLFVIWFYGFLAMPEHFFNVQESDPESIYYFELFKRPVQFLSSILYTFFVIYYLELLHRKNTVIRIFKVLIGFYIFCIIGTFTLNYFRIPYSPYYFMVGLLLLPVQMYVLTALFKSRIPYSRFIIWGSLITITGSLVALLLTIYDQRSESVEPMVNTIIFMPAQVCILIDMFLFSIALQTKIADNEKRLVNAALERQQAIMLERERIIADLHDDVGGGLSSIRMTSDLMAQLPGTDTRQGAFAEKISTTAKEIALRMNTIIWSLNEENDKLDNFIEYIRHFGITYFEGSPVSFHFSDDVQGNSDIELSGVLRKNLFLIIKEALHNTLKHADATRSDVVVKLHQNNLEIDISDNGKGFDFLKSGNHIGMGNGLKNMQKRAEEIQGKISIASDNGTKIIVRARIGVGR